MSSDLKYEDIDDNSLYDMLSELNNEIQRLEDDIRSINALRSSDEFILSTFRHMGSIVIDSDAVDPSAIKEGINEKVDRLQKLKQKKLAIWEIFTKGEQEV